MLPPPVISPVIPAFTKISIVAGIPHDPAEGVNVYIELPVVAVLMVKGFHVPVILLFDVVGSDGAADPWHSGPICVNVGVTWFEITTSIVVVEPHCPAEGVNV